MASGRDPYEGFSFRELFDWKRRLARETPFLESTLARAPERSVADLGCGNGEHARLFASLGFRTVGVDRSPAMLEQARDHEDPPRLTFVEGDLLTLADSLVGRFGAAVCLGNTLPHVETEADLEIAFRNVASFLVPGGIFLAQLLNYERILSQGIRSMPVTIVPSSDGWTVLLRLLQPEEGGIIRFCPTVLRWTPDREPAVEVLESRSLEHRAWGAPEIAGALAAAGFSEPLFFGDMTGGPYEPASSVDLVVVARAGGAR